MKTKDLDIDVLIGAEYNPRKISGKQMGELKDSIKRFGFVEPIIVNNSEQRKNIVISGHQRLEAAKQLGFEKVPVLFVDLSEQQEKELNIRMNKAGGDFDFEALSDFFDQNDLIEWGFEESELFESTDSTQEKSAPDIDLSEDYRIEVHLSSEREQETLFNELTEKGYICKVLTL